MDKVRLKAILVLLTMLAISVGIVIAIIEAFGG